MTGCFTIPYRGADGNMYETRSNIETSYSRKSGFTTRAVSSTSCEGRTCTPKYEARSCGNGGQSYLQNSLEGRKLVTTTPSCH